MTIIKDMILIALIFLAVWISFHLWTRHDTVENKVVRYDCRIAEFSPDIPNDVREECRRKAIEQYNQTKGK